MSVEVKEALISDEGATSGIEEHHQYHGKAGKGSKGYAYYGVKGSKGGYGYGGRYGSGNGDSEPVHEPEASGDWEPELEPVHHESDDYYVYGKSSKGGKGLKGGYGNGDGHYAEPDAGPELAGNSGSGDWW